MTTAAVVYTLHMCRWFGQSPLLVVYAAGTYLAVNLASPVFAAAADPEYNLYL